MHLLLCCYQKKKKSYIVRQRAESFDFNASRHHFFCSIFSWARVKDAPPIFLSQLMENTPFSLISFLSSLFPIQPNGPLRLWSNM
jgi:hypothetical protein